MTTIDELEHLCRDLGAPGRELAVLGEGNASARLDEASFAVTTSGSELGRLTSGDLVAVQLAPAAALARRCADGTFDRAELDALAVPNSDGTRRVPSIETLLHALLLERTGCAFVGHTHPTSVLALACSSRLDEAFAAPIFPDEVVVCGPAYLVVPYAAPGPALAAALDSALDRHAEESGVWPRAIILASHGLLALGATANEVLAVTTMVDKSARVRAAALAIGELRTLSAEEVRTLDGRSDEQYRRQRLFGAGA
ncbi:MAG: class II aldolase/adducin family protein [Actinobacteria bacterium]|nr:class II aldolase/adducin family protein [Actinomycetota bacterium]